MLYYGKWNRETLIDFEDLEKIKRKAEKSHGKFIRIIIEDISAKTRQQEKYYWGVILKELSYEIGYSGKELHNYFKYLMAVADTANTQYVTLSIPYLDINHFIELYESGHEVVHKITNLYTSTIYTKEQYMLLIKTALEFAEKAGVYIPPIEK